MMMNFSAWLQKQFQLHPEINQTSLALSIHVGQSTVSNWLRGLSRPDPENCRKVAQYFHVPILDLLTLAGHAPTSYDLPALHDARATYYTPADPALAEALRLFSTFDDATQHHVLSIMRTFIAEKERSHES